MTPDTTLAIGGMPEGKRVPVCTRGEWRTYFAVFGFWNDSNGGGDVAFEANLYSH